LIKKGNFIIEYIGEIFHKDDKEFLRREHKRFLSSHTYTMSLGSHGFFIDASK